jgi:segregation and condensation protein A
MNEHENETGQPEENAAPQQEPAVTPEAIPETVSEIVAAAENVIAQEELKEIDKVNPLHVKIAVYDGPFDLLLDLIKKNEMDIYNIQVSEITGQYLAYLAKIKELDLEIAGEFIVMAATLLYIKSKMLLPQDGTEEDEDGGDPRAELVRKLLEYQAFKHAAKELGFLEDERGKVFTRQLSEYYLSEMDAADVEIDTFSANLFDLLTAFQSVLAKGSKENVHEVFEQVVSIEDKMTEIRTRLVERKKVVFSDLFKNGWTRNLLIVTFLAVLEIVRTKIARVVQEQQYGEIYIEQLPETIGA